MRSLWNRLARLFRPKAVSHDEAIAGRAAQDDVDRARAAAQHHYQVRTVQNSGWFM